MPYDSLSDTLTHDSPAARRISAILAWIAGIALVGNCLLSCPQRFSDAHRQDDSILKTIISALALAAPDAERGAFTTARGVEIRNFVYYSAAALLCIAGGIRLLTTTARPRLTGDDLWNFRARAGSPVFWMIVLAGVSALTSFLSSHAPDISFGGVVIRMMQMAWWWPIALLLLPMHSKRLTGWLVAAVTACTVLGIWYYTARTNGQWFNQLQSLKLPDRRMEYPIGNSLWFGACILPAIFAAMGLAMESFRGSGTDDAGRRQGASKLIGILAIGAAVITFVGLILTQSRSSAWVGFAAGIAFAFVIMVRRPARPAVALVALCLALGGVWWIQSLRSTGVMGERAHSIRTRLNYEWPLAIALFKEKPVGGNGEGGYALLAPGFARTLQLEEPSTKAMGENFWFAQAHNEYLDLLADLGLVGAAAFVLALAITLYYAVRYCDTARASPSERPYRWLVIGLGTALFGMMLEECSSVALREPGFTPLFLTVWAILWAIVRVERRPATMSTAPSEPEQSEADTPEAVSTSPGDNPRLSNGVFRGLGVAAAALGLALGYYGYQDWIGIQESRAAQSAINDGRFEAAILHADFAGEHILEPFQRMLAKMYAVKARTAVLSQKVAGGAKPDDATIPEAVNILNAIVRVDRAAPRFLSISRLRTEVFRLLIHIARDRGDAAQAQSYLKQYQDSLAQSFRDDPFNTAIVSQMWRDIPQASPHERMDWLRCLIRSGEMDAATRAMLEDMFKHVPQSLDALNGLLRIADADSKARAELWTDRLAPETFRIGALIKDWMGLSADAAKLAERADKMYDSAGPALFAAHAASIRESVIYRLHEAPTENTEQLLDALVRAATIRFGRSPDGGEDARRQNLPLEIGETRVLVLAAAGREDDAKSQLAAITGALPAGAALPTLAGAYSELAAQFGAKKQFADLVIRWADRARELDGTLPIPDYALVSVYLDKDDLENGLAAAKRFVEHMDSRDRAFELLQTLEVRRRESRLWPALRTAFPDYPELPLEEPTSQPATSQGAEPESEDGRDSATPADSTTQPAE